MKNTLIEKTVTVLAALLLTLSAVSCSHEIRTHETQQGGQLGEGTVTEAAQ